MRIFDKDGRSDPLTCANKQIEVLQEKLAKANERVKSLEQTNLELAANVESCCKLVDMDMGAAIERLFEIDNTESKALLNKFAIEKKIEALKDFKSAFDAQNDYWGNSPMAYVSDLDKAIEQLSKEQE